MSNKIKKGIPLHEKQGEAFDYLTTPGIQTVLFGGSVSCGKTLLACAFLLWACINHPGRYLIGRKRLTDLRNSTLVTLFDCAKIMGIDDELRAGFNAQLNTITFRSSTILLRPLDVKPSDPNMEEMGGLEITAAIVDEVGEIEEVVYNKLIERLRYKLPAYGGKILLVSNPTKNWAYHRIYIPWEEKRLPSHIRYVHTIPSDNPFNSQSYLSTLTIENLGPEAYYSRVCGDWHYTIGDQDLFIETDIINACNWSADGFAEGEKTLSIDVASKTGSDSTVAMLFAGRTLTACWEWKGKDTLELEKEIRPIIQKHNVPIRRVIVDANGVGQGLADLLRGCVQFKSSLSRLNNEGYQTLRDQMFYRAAQMFSRGELRIAISGESRSQLVKELCAHKKHHRDGASLARVQPKELVSRALKGKSPDYADAFVMSMYAIAYGKRPITVRSHRFQ